MTKHCLVSIDVLNAFSPSNNNINVFREGKEVRSMQTRIKLHMCKLECKLLHVFVMVIELLGYKPERAQH